jgi:hypothetical protein
MFRATPNPTFKHRPSGNCGKDWKDGTIDFRQRVVYRCHCALEYPQNGAVDSPALRALLKFQPIPRAPFFPRRFSSVSPLAERP